jgi:hypothetical protein
MSATTVIALPVDASGPATGTTPSQTFVPSLARAGRRVAASISAGAERYYEHWEDLVHEARASTRAPEEGTSVGSVLASLSEASVESDIPGRVRLRQKQLRGRTRLAEETAAALAGVDGIDRAHVSALTGSVLIFYDARRYGTREALLEAIGRPE